MKNTYHLYSKVYRNALLTLNAYKMNTITKIVYSLLLFIIQIYIWEAVYISRDAFQTRFGAVGLNDMITYVFLSASISVFANFEGSAVHRIGQKVVTGEIASDLLRPVSLMGYLFAEYAGSFTYRFFFNLIPVAGVAFVMFRIQIPLRWDEWWLFLLSIFNVGILYFLMTYCVGLLSFWYEKVGNLNILIDSSITLLSGSVIPLWLFPDIVANIIHWTPFPYLYFFPISLALGKLGMQEIWSGLVIQFAWILLLYLLSKLIYKRGISKLTIQGG